MYAQTQPSLGALEGSIHGRLPVDAVQNPGPWAVPESGRLDGNGSRPEDPAIGPRDRRGRLPGEKPSGLGLENRSRRKGGFMGRGLAGGNRRV